MQWDIRSSHFLSRYFPFIWKLRLVSIFGMCNDLLGPFRLVDCSCRILDCVMKQTSHHYFPSVIELESGHGVALRNPVMLHPFFDP
jgi:hypothetical protein